MHSKRTCIIKALNKLIQKASLSSLLKLAGLTFPSCSTRDLLIILQIYRDVKSNYSHLLHLVLHKMVALMHHLQFMMLCQFSEFQNKTTNPKKNTYYANLKYEAIQEASKFDSIPAFQGTLNLKRKKRVPTN